MRYLTNAMAVLILLTSSAFAAPLVVRADGDSAPAARRAEEVLAADWKAADQTIEKWIAATNAELDHDYRWQDYAERSQTIWATSFKTAAVDYPMSRGALARLRQRVSPVLKLHSARGLHLVVLRFARRQAVLIGDTIFLDARYAQADDEELWSVVGHELGHRLEAAAFSASKWETPHQLREYELLSDAVALWTLRRLGLSAAGVERFILNLNNTRGDAKDDHPTNEARLTFVAHLNAEWHASALLAVRAVGAASSQVAARAVAERQTIFVRSVRALGAASSSAARSAAKLINSKEASNPNARTQIQD